MIGSPIIHYWMINHPSLRWRAPPIKRLPLHWRMPFS